jgi:hypothetical protein
MKTLQSYSVMLMYTRTQETRSILATSPADALTKAHANYPGAMPVVVYGS